MVIGFPLNQGEIEIDMVLFHPQNWLIMTFQIMEELARHKIWFVWSSLMNIRWEKLCNEEEVVVARLIFYKYNFFRGSEIWAMIIPLKTPVIVS